MQGDLLNSVNWVTEKISFKPVDMFVTDPRFASGPEFFPDISRQERGLQRFKSLQKSRLCSDHKISNAWDEGKYYRVSLSFKIIYSFTSQRILLFFLASVVAAGTNVRFPTKTL